MTRDHVLARTADLERRGFRVVAYDSRGHGRSARAADPGGYTYDLLLEDLVAVMDALDCERAVLVGSSMGAHTALRLAIDAPERVAGLGVVSPAYDPSNHPNRPNVEEADELAAAIRERGLDGFLDALRIPPAASRDSVTLQAAHALTRRRLEDHLDVAAIADALQANIRAKPFDSFAELGSIDVPTVVVGTRDELDPRHPLELARRYAEALPESRFACEERGRMPLGWGGRRLTHLVSELAERADWSAPRLQRRAHGSPA
jgi:3-oxoadipate enol-lactonase